MKGADSDHPEGQSFGRWRFDAGTGDLFDGTTTTRLEPQVAKLLDYFLAHQDTLVTRDELIAAVWDERIVSDDAINRCVSILRQVLTPDEKNAFIETVLRRGFVSHFPPPPARAAPVAQRSRRNRYWIFGVLAGVAAIALYVAFHTFRDSAPPVRGVEREGSPTVAVLPFVTSGLAGDSEFFANGIHDDLLTRLAQLQSIRVISRTSVYEYRDGGRNIREIGRELGADAILEGGVQRVGDQIRLNVQLIDAQTDGHLWAEQYDRELSPENIFEVQTEIARAIASALHITMTEEDATLLNVLPTKNMSAYRAYHQAMEMRNTDTIAAPAYLAALEEAVALDPEFVRAWAELAGSLSFANISRPDPDSIRRLETILERIRELAPWSAEYVLAQAYYTYYILKDYPHAYELVSQAQNLIPSDPRVLELKSWIQRRLGDFEGRNASIRLARTLDPRNPHWTENLAAGLIVTHRYDEAIREIEGFPIQNLELAVLQNTLQMRIHRDPLRRLDALAALQTEFGAEADSFERWESHVAARDFLGANEILASVGATVPPSDEWTPFRIAGVEVPRIITCWFLHEESCLGPFLEQARTVLADQRESDAGYFETNRNLAAAFITAAEGDTQETERLIRAWSRDAGADLAELANNRHYACRALGMAVATSAAVECIRTALVEPSRAMPFIEPFLPYYDSMRNQPEFVGLLEDLWAH